MVLPDGLPIPEDDGGCDHLPSAEVPSVALPGTDGEVYDLRSLSGRTVVYAYPWTGRPGEPLLTESWDLIPGARGCTPETCGFRDHHAELAALGARVFGLSTQETDYQRELAERLSLPFPVLSDARHDLTSALDLPVLNASGRTLLKRLTLVIADGKIEHVFYPVFPPDRHAGEVVSWLGERSA